MITHADEIRFWCYVDKDGPVPEERPELGQCWLWTKYINHNGYGLFSLNKRRERAHRVALLLSGVSVPEGMFPDHLCRVRSCVRPSHLEVVSRKENNHRTIGNGFQINAAKTHCKHGHPFDAENTRIETEHGRQRRRCITCARENNARYELRLRERAALS